MKVCSKCKRKLNEENFYKSGKNKNGLRSDCKECHNTYIKLNRYKYKNKRIEYLKNNRKKILEQRKKRRDYRKEHNPKYRWSYGTLHSHKEKNIKINISAKELLSLVLYIEHCRICGTLLDWKCINGKSNLCSPTLDRINNDNFIDKNNIMIICHQCNTTKNVRTLDEFINYCKMIYLKFGDIK